MEELVIGAKEIGATFRPGAQDPGAHFIELVGYRRTIPGFAECFRKIDGKPVLDLRAYRNFAAGCGLDPDPAGFDADAARRFAKRQEIARMESWELVGVNHISEETGWPIHEIQAWLRGYDDCPIVVGPDRVWMVDLRAILLFMFDHGLPRHYKGSYNLR